MLAITDWVEEFNELSHNPIPEIPEALLILYSSSKKAQGQFPLPPSSEEPGVTDVRTQSQAVWTYLCAILQYFEDDMATWEGALYGGKTRKPSALVLYIMEHVNPGLLEPYRVHWPNIVGKTLWLAFWDHLSRDELKRFYQEPGPDDPLELEQATEDVCCQADEDAAQREELDRPIPHLVLTKLKPRTLQECSFWTTKTRQIAKPNQLLLRYRIGLISLNRDLIGLNTWRARRVRVHWRHNRYYPRQFSR